MSLFRDRSRLRQLKAIVECKLPEFADEFKPTGIPPHVLLMNEVADLRSQICKIMPAIVETSDVITNKIVTVLEERAMVSNTVTRDGLLELITDSISNILEANGVMRNQLQEPEIEPEVILNPIVPNVFFWGGAHHVVPHTFKIPTCNTRIAFQLWLLGNPQRQHPPYKQLSPVDMPSSNDRKRLSDFAVLMKRIESKVVEIDAWIEDPSSIDVDRMYDAVIDLIEIPDLTPANRERRLGQLAWRTIKKDIYNNTRNNRRNRRG